MDRDSKKLGSRVVDISIMFLPEEQVEEFVSEQLGNGDFAMGREFVISSMGRIGKLESN